MERYDERTYGDSFADVYDEWYDGVTDVAATVADLVRLAEPGCQVAELGVGTGRLAVPLAHAGRSEGLRVTGIDASQAMLDRLAARDPAGDVATVLADMLDGLAMLPSTPPCRLVFIAYNTLFNLTADGAQQRCFELVAATVGSGGRFVVEAFVPADPARHGDEVGVRSIAADRVVLSISRHDARRSTVDGQFVELTEAHGVRLRPWAIRYATVEQLDAYADRARMTLEHRWEAFGGAPFGPDSPRHVSVYRAG